MQEKAQEKKSGFGMPRILKELDMFGGPLPTFNIRGKSIVQTHAGGLVSLAILITTLFFAAFKLTALKDRRNPEINIYVEKDAFHNTDRFNVREKNFRMAFGFTDYFIKELKNDKTYIKWYARYFEK